ncbi:hypothetical protein BEN30_01565 [Magnetovibrio blakemorei]|uniref:Uncharacterized protein n=1 Tax=Magnetovibrio blakemorei TaxID=28181 RepID=A0A1E5Q3E1_9PROT|nr:hypothetical protein BEN30_01565 [Magnetovibrio blakemorei]
MKGVTSGVTSELYVYSEHLRDITPRRAGKKRTNMTKSKIVEKPSHHDIRIRKVNFDKMKDQHE